MKYAWLLFMLFLVNSMKGSAKPKVHVEGSLEVLVGRKKMDCKQIWLCLSDPGMDIKSGTGMITDGHPGLILDEDGSLAIAIPQESLRKQSPLKYETLNSGSMVLEGDETLPQNWLDALGFKGENLFKAGVYIVTVYQGYFMIHLKDV